MLLCGRWGMNRLYVHVVHHENFEAGFHPPKENMFLKPEEQCAAVAILPRTKGSLDSIPKPFL